MTDRVTVRGTASDPDGVSQVLINDVGVLTVGAVSAQSDASPSATRVQFAAEVTLQPGENQISVSVQDSLGEITDEAEPVTVGYVEVPTRFDVDQAGLRLAGLGSEPLDSAAGPKLVVLDYATGMQTVYPQRFPSVSALCLKGDVDAFIYLQNLTGSLELRRFDLVGRHDSRIVSVPPAALDPGVDHASPGRVVSLECGRGDAHAYATFEFPHVSAGTPKSRVLRIGLDSQLIEVLADTNPADSPPWLPSHTALTADGLLTLNGNSDEPLWRVELDTGAVSTLTPFDVDGQAIAPAASLGKIYLAGIAGVDEIDLADPPSLRNVSHVQSTDPFVFSQVRSAAYDPVEDRLIVGDSDLDMLVEVDVATGERAELMARSVGEGVRMIAPRRMVITEDMTRAYVLDDGSNAPEKLFEVDLITGDRRVIGDIDDVHNVRVSGLAVDEGARVAYVAVDTSVLRIHLDTEAVAVQAGAAAPGSEFDSISDLLLDAARDRLLVADAVREAIVAIDLLSGLQTVLSQAGLAGAGPAFENINSLALERSTGYLYATNQLGGNVMRIDPVSGNRQVVLDACLDDEADDVLGDQETLQQILYRDSTGDFLILGDNLIVYDPQTSGCNVVQPVARSLLQLQDTADGRLLGLGFGALVQYDIESGEAVMVSK